MAYDNIKIHKKQGFTLFIENTFLEKPQRGGVKLTPHSSLCRVKACPVSHIPSKHHKPL